MCEALSAIDRQQKVPMPMAALRMWVYWAKEDCGKEGEILEWLSLSIDQFQSGRAPSEAAVRAGQTRQLHHVVQTDLVKEVIEVQVQVADQSDREIQH